ncbi:MAG: hypothetical protein KAW14_05920 [Candidatus Aegiribacteria sp.]|nr:hypothetical protein [Candidatus Aegiribacteria sp.]
MDSECNGNAMTVMRKYFRDSSGMLFHFAAAAVIFILWRVFGMPLPGTLGRLIPFSWILTGVVYGKGKVPELSKVLLPVHLLLSLFWGASPAIEILAAASGFMGIFPGLLAVSRKPAGILRALIPLIPLIIILVPFTGDEPHYATITEGFISPGSGEFGNLTHQRGDPSASVTHHQLLYPALMIPGYPLSSAGLRGMNLIFALAAVMILSELFKRKKLSNWRYLAVLGFLFVPGSRVLGLVYPGWLALLVFIAGVLLATESRRTLFRRSLWIIIISFILVLIKFRFAGISAGLLLALFIRTEGKRKFVLPIVFTGLVILGLSFDLFTGGRIFWVRYGNIDFIKALIIQPLFRTPEILLACGASLVDIEAGLLWKAPWILAGLAGLPLLRKKYSDLFIWLGLPALIYFLFLILWTTHDWAGMPTPPGRMLLPVLPVFLASLGCMLRERSVRYLIWMSLGISAIYFTYPQLQFNYADGTDTLVSAILGHHSNISEWIPSAVRLNVPVLLGWIAIACMLIWMIAKRSRYACPAIITVFLLLGCLAGQKRTAWEAEDIPSEYRSFCTIYPENPDPESRKFWFFSREKMLYLSSSEDVVYLPLPSDCGDSVRLEIMFRSLQSGPIPGIEISCGDFHDSIYISSEVLEKPEWVGIFRDIQLDRIPENLEEIHAEFIIPVDDTEGIVRISPLGVFHEYGETHGIYLDRIEFK